MQVQGSGNESKPYGPSELDARNTHDIRCVLAKQTVVVLPADRRLDLPLRVAVEEHVKRLAGLHERRLDGVRAIVDREHRGERSAGPEGEPQTEKQT